MKYDVEGAVKRTSMREGEIKVSAEIFRRTLFVARSQRLLSVGSFSRSQGCPVNNLSVPDNITISYSYSPHTEEGGQGDSSSVDNCLLFRDPNAQKKRLQREEAEISENGA
ncbi:hypothetical protein Bbelb_217820 [Branchiostoma belcheri]|nr:hypothetical protein Bbelb_217820 [Branchiostoma belcheri]